METIDHDKLGNISFSFAKMSPSYYFTQIPDLLSPWTINSIQPVASPVVVPAHVHSLLSHLHVDTDTWISQDNIQKYNR